MSADGAAEPRPSDEPPAQGRRIDRLAAVLVALATVGWLLAVEGRMGIGRDEAQYFRAGERYWGWFAELGDNLAAGRRGGSFTASGVKRYWDDNPEHPPVMKVLYGASWRAFHTCRCPSVAGHHPIPVARHRTLPLFTRDSTAFRFPAFLMTGLGAALVYLFARHWLRRPYAAAAAVLFVAQPHFFFHAQLSAFDAPITVMALAVGFAYWKSLRTPRWGILAGVVFGLALGVKHNAWLMPVFLVGHYVWMRRGDLLRLRPPPVPLVFLSMLLLAPIVFYGLWPRLWVDPVGQTRWYLLRHLEHEHYNFEYLGLNWNLPPKDLDLQLLRATFPFVSTLLTVPVTTLALAVAGAVLLCRRRRAEADGLLAAAPPVGACSWLRPGADIDRAPGAFFFVQILGPMAVLAVPSTPIFGGVKHFMTAAPFLAIVAAMGLAGVVHLLVGVARDARLARALPSGLSALVCLPAVVETQRSQPDGLSHYNLLAGGFAGGASIGMNRQFWGYPVLPMLPWIVAHEPPSRAIYWHDVMPDALSMYVRDRRLPPGIGNVGGGEEIIAASDLALVFHEKHFANYEALVWEAYGGARPARVRDREGVPIVTAYARASARPSPSASPLAAPAPSPGASPAATPAHGAPAQPPAAGTSP